MLDLRQTPEYAKYMKSIGWIVERKNGVNYFIKKFPFLGSFIKIQRPRKFNDEKIEQLSHKYRAFQIVIEPKNKHQESRIRKNGFKQSKSPFVPSKTIQINLVKTQKRLLKEMQKETRYSIRKANSNKLKFTISKDINAFADFWQKCAREQRGMYFSQIKEIEAIYNAFGKKAHILLVTKSLSSRANKESAAISQGLLRRSAPRNYNLEILSGILLVRTKDSAYYMYAASTKEGKKLFAPTLNAWEAIKLAKKLGCKVFDFEGIYDERFPLKSWQGFTRFKKSFGGKEIVYPGAFVKYRLPI